MAEALFGVASKLPVKRDLKQEGLGRKTLIFILKAKTKIHHLSATITRSRAMAALGISVASVTLATLANPLVRYAYEKIVSIQNAKEDLEKLERSLETIKGALLNAEKFEEEPAVKDWIKRVRDVLYDADDLFDEIAIDAELKKLNESGYQLLERVKRLFKHSD